VNGFVVENAVANNVHAKSGVNLSGKTILAVSTAGMFGLTVLALGLRLYCLDCWGLWYDEVISVEVARGGPADIIASRFGWVGNQTPAYYLVLWVLTQVADPVQTSAFVRLPSVIAGALAVPVLYLLGRDTFGRTVGLLAATLLALSLPALNYSQDARQYAVTLFLTLLALYSLTRIRLGGWGIWWAIFASATVANLVYSYLSVTLVLPSLAVLGAWVLWRRWQMRAQVRFSWAPPLIAAAAIGIAAASSGLEILSHAGVPTDPNRAQFGDPLYVSFAILQWLFRMGLPDYIHIQVVVYLLPLGLLGLVYGFRAGGAARWAVSFMSLLILVSLAEVIVLTSARFVHPRYLFFVLPYFLLLIAHGAATLASLISSVPARKWPVISSAANLVVSVVLITVFAMGTANYYNPHIFPQENERPEYKAAAAYLRAVAQPGDIIVVASYGGFGFAVLNYYFDGQPPAPVYHALDPRLYDVASPRRMFVLMNSWGQTMPDRDFREEQLDLQYVYGSSTAVLTLDGNGKPVTELMNMWIEPLSKSLATDTLVLALQGGLFQARGDVTRAVETYAQTRAGNPAAALWPEYLATLQGFQSRGDGDLAWAELMNAKQNGSGQPEVHRELAKALAGRGLKTLAAQEDRIAAELDALTEAAAGEK
jgi:4-amino-4-deoxy-L-arabinose transferase-like glycosyltransferase